MTQELLDLAERCEKATEGSRELSDRIAEGAGYREDNTRNPHRWWFDPDGREFIGYPPDYSQSLDAAMTLVPEGWYLGDLTQCNEDDEPQACLTEIDEPCRDAGAVAATLSLALCAAALRARAQQEKTKP